MLWLAYVVMETRAGLAAQVEHCSGDHLLLFPICHDPGYGTTSVAFGAILFQWLEATAANNPCFLAVRKISRFF